MNTIHLIHNKPIGFSCLETGAFFPKDENSKKPQNVNAHTFVQFKYSDAEVFISLKYESLQHI